MFLTLFALAYNAVIKDGVFATIRNFGRELLESSLYSCCKEVMSLSLSVMFESSVMCYVYDVLCCVMCDK